MAVVAACDHDGNVLVDVRFAVESDLERWERRLPMPASLVVVRFEDSVLMMFNGWRRQWELPGGMRELARPRGRLPCGSWPKAGIRSVELDNEEAAAFLWWNPQSSVPEQLNPIDAEMVRRTIHRQIQ